MHTNAYRLSDHHIQLAQWGLKEHPKREHPMQEHPKQEYPKQERMWSAMHCEMAGVLP